MASVERNIERLDTKVEKLRLAVERAVSRAERRLIKDLEDADNKRDVREALSLLGNFDAELNRTTIKELRDSVSEIYGSVAGDVRSAFQDAGIKFELRQAEISAIADLTQADFDLLESHVIKYARTVKANVLRQTFTGGEIRDVEAVIDSARENFLNNLQKDSINVSQSFRNAIAYQKAQEAGVERMIYDGPKDAKNRPFCAEHVGNSYTMEEIQDMRNQDDMPALTDMGGYNCRHEWRPDGES